jgi:hypothetical protein
MSDIAASAIRRQEKSQIALDVSGSVDAKRRDAIFADLQPLQHLQGHKLDLVASLAHWVVAPASWAGHLALERMASEPLAHYMHGG